MSVPARKPALTCPICNATLTTDREAMDHTREHALQIVSGPQVAAGPDEPLAFIVNMRGHLMSSVDRARKLAQARAELKRYFPGYKFECVIGTFHMLNNVRGAPLVIEAPVVEYFFVLK